MINQKWEVGQVKLVNGMEATILLFDEIRKVYLGAYRVPGGGLYAFEWWEDGRPMDNSKNFNLAPPPKKTMRFKRFICLYRDCWTSHLTKEESMADMGKDVFAMIEIDREVTEGEGLSETPN